MQLGNCQIAAQHRRPLSCGEVPCLCGLPLIGAMMQAVAGRKQEVYAARRHNEASVPRSSLGVAAL